MSRSSVYIPFGGGLDYVTPALDIAPGVLIGGINFEITPKGGYSRITGYERYDGQASPSDQSDDNDYAAHETQRALITEVPGEGDVLGVAIYKGTVYAWRNVAGGAYTGFYKATGSGWSALSTSTIAPDGRIDHVSYNFYGNSASRELYFTNSEGKAYAFEDVGPSLTAITSGYTPDEPIHIIAHQVRLYMSFIGGGTEFSAVGDPTDFTGVGGASYIDQGDEITGLSSLPGSSGTASMAVFCRNSTWIYSGNDPAAADFTVISHSRESGAIEWTVQSIGTPVYVDDRGITTLTATDAYGDFISNSISSLVEPYLTSRLDTITASVRVKEKDQYRVFFEDKSSLTVAFEKGSVKGITRSRFDFQVTCATSGEDSNGREMVLFGGDDGFIYQEKGNNFDGDPIQAAARTAFYDYGTPKNNKRFLAIEFNLDTTNPNSTINVIADMDYSSTEQSPSPLGTDVDMIAGGGFWDDATWDDFYWSAQVVGEAKTHLRGAGKNMGIVVATNTTYDDSYTLYGMTIDYELGGLRR